MAKITPARRSGPRLMAFGLAAGLLTISLVACGGGTSMSTATQPSAAAGQCHVICSDASPSGYLAIAVSPSALVCGAGVSAASSEAAKKQAVLVCGHSDCTPVVWGKDGVGAVAVNQTAYGWGWANDASSTAENRALTLCESRTP